MVRSDDRCASRLPTVPKLIQPLPRIYHEGCPESRQWNSDGSYANNIRYADDTTLLDHDIDHLQTATDKLEQACKKWGMKINTSKCKVISSDKRNITINGEAIETVDKFTFLGSSVPAVADDVQRRINLAAWAFGRLRDKIWSNQNISRTIKVRI